MSFGRLKKFLGILPTDPPASMEQQAAKMKLEDLQRRTQILKQQAQAMKRRGN